MDQAETPYYPMIQVGESLPDVEVQLSLGRERALDAEYQSVQSALAGRSILVGMPGAFTPTCTDLHLPGFLQEDVSATYNRFKCEQI